jgi:hypothetical protein
MNHAAFCLVDGKSNNYDPVKPIDLNCFHKSIKLMFNQKCCQCLKKYSWKIRFIHSFGKISLMLTVDRT